jgi:hypothetical protein
VDYSPEQRDIIRRLGEVSREMDRVAEAELIAQTATTTAISNAGQSLLTAIESLQATLRYSAEIHKLGKQHGDLFREFLDSLA